jgi:putative ABC transport system permease protein
MFKNYLLVACRNLVRNKAFSFINLLGLSLGMASSLLIFLWVQDERGVDSTVAGGPGVYTVYENLVSDGKPDPGYWTPGLLPRELRRSVPDIQYASGYWNREDQPSVFEAGDKNIPYEGTCYADSDFFKVFPYPLLEGTAATALAGVDDMAISRQMAVNFFGSPQAAYGKTLRYDNLRDFRIAAVFDDLPAHNSQHFEYLLNWHFLLTSVTWLYDWIYRSPNTFIRLRPLANPARVEAKISQFLAPYLKDAKVGAGYQTTLGLQPYEETYLRSTFRNGQPATGRIEYVRLFSVVAIFILLIACINFMNLATARSVRRAKEVGIRKTVGAMRSWLIAQFIGEALLLTAMAVVLAVVIAVLLLPTFNQLTHKQIGIPFSNPAFWSGMVGFMLITGIIAGSYPALFLSSLQPVKVLKGTLRFSAGALLFRKGLVVFQFVLSIVLITATIVISKQVDYMQTKDLGFDKANLIYMPFQGDLLGKYEVFKQQLSDMPGIEGVTRSTQAPSHIGAHVYDIDWEGKNPNNRIVAMHNGVGYGYVKMLGLKIIQGRDFSRDYPTDSVGYILNETALRMTGYKDPVGRRFSFFGQQGHIIGVVKDFHLRSLHDPIEPLILYLGETTDWGNVLVKTEPGKTREALSAMESVFRTMEPKFPFRYSFADEEYQKLYDNERTVSRLSDSFSFLAIFISCLGLLGLTMFTAEQRTKEIGVRKVIGASVMDIVLMLSKDIVGLVLLASVIAIPLAWIGMNSWLDNYAYRIPITIWIFLAAVVMAVIVALGTISYQAIKAARANPVKSLQVN